MVTGAISPVTIGPILLRGGNFRKTFWMYFLIIAKLEFLGPGPNGWCFVALHPQFTASFSETEFLFDFTLKMRYKNL